MLKRHLVLVGALVLAGCQPGTYNVNVGVAPLVATPSSSPAPVASSTPAAVVTFPPSGAPASAAPGAGPVQEAVTSYQQVGNGTRLAQTFTIAKDGGLTAAAVRLKGVSADRQPTLAVFAADGDRPGPGPALVSATLPVVADGAWATATFAAQLPVKAGDRYALVLSLAAPFAIYAGANLDTSYVEGTAFTGLTDGSTFWNKVGQDLAFKVTLQ